MSNWRTIPPPDALGMRAHRISFWSSAMGTWGPGVFENDAALDYVCLLIEKLAKSIEKCVDMPRSLTLFGEGEEVVLPSVQIIVLLCARCHGTAPEVQVIRRWRDIYLQDFDKNVDQLQLKPDYKRARRQIIEGTFASLERLALSQSE